MTDHKSITDLLKTKNISAFALRMLNSISQLGNFRLLYLSPSNKAIAMVDKLSRASYQTDERTRWHDIYTDEEIQINAITTRSRAKNAERKRGRIEDKRENEGRRNAGAVEEEEESDDENNDESDESNEEKEEEREGRDSPTRTAKKGSKKRKQKNKTQYADGTEKWIKIQEKDRDLKILKS